MPEYCLRLSVYNTNREILDEIQRIWGGTLSVVEQRKPNWKQSYALIWTNASAARLLEQLAPFLRIKSRQVDTCLRFQEHIRRCKRQRTSGGQLASLSLDERMIRERYYRRLKELNTRDPAVRRQTGDSAPPWIRQQDPPAEYLAGFMDAEGSFMIVKSKASRSRGTQVRARISAASTDLAVIEDIRRAYGGIMVNQARRKSKWNPSHQLVWTSGQIGPLLRSIRPHLRIKGKQADLLIDFARHKTSTQQGRSGRCFAALPGEVVVFRENLYNRVHELNAKGPPSTVPVEARET